MLHEVGFSGQLCKPQWGRLGGWNPGQLGSPRIPPPQWRGREEVGILMGGWGRRETYCQKFYPLGDQASQVGLGAQVRASGETEILESHIQRPWCDQGGPRKASAQGGWDSLRPRVPSS